LQGSNSFANELNREQVHQTSITTVGQKRYLDIAIDLLISNFVRLKSRALHIVSSVFLIGSLLFAQVGVNFFHNNHDVHQLKSVSAPLKDGAAGVQKHDEHCKVCSIDFFNHAFIPSTLLTFDHPVFNTHEVQHNFCIERIAQSYSQGRAPPFSI